MRIVGWLALIVGISCGNLGNGLGVVQEVKATSPKDREAYGLTPKPEGCPLEFVRERPKVAYLVYITTIRIDAGISTDDPWSAAVQKEVGPRACRAGGEVVEFEKVEVQTEASRSTAFEYHIHGKMSEEAIARLKAKAAH